MLLAALALVLFSDRARGLDYVTLMQDGQRRELEGRIEVEAEDGGVLLQGRDGVLWPVPKEELIDRRKDDKPFLPLSREELAKKITADLPDGFRIHSTKHYLVCYNTSPAYAEWVGGLYERLFAAFYNYWQRRKVELKEPEFPLVALVFDSQPTYARYARTELGDATKTIIGYYSLKSNQVNMYDLTGIEELNFSGNRNSSARINAILSQPGERTVARSSTKRRTSSPSTVVCRPALPTSRSGSAKGSPSTSRPPTCKVPKAGGTSAASIASICSISAGRFAIARPTRWRGCFPTTSVSAIRRLPPMRMPRPGR
jgi:hypothetical protein